MWKIAKTKKRITPFFPDYTQKDLPSWEFFWNVLTNLIKTLIINSFS